MSTASDAVRSQVLALKSRMGDGTSALFLVHIVANVTRFGSNLILTRILTPEAFGVVAIVNSIQTVLSLMTDVAIRPFYTRHPAATLSTLRTAWTVKFIRDLSLAVATYLSAGTLASLFGHPEAADPLRACAAILAIEAFKSPALLTIARERRLFKISLYDLISQLVATATTIALAFVLKSYWAIVVGMLVSHVAALGVSYFWFGRPTLPRFELDRATLADLWKMARVTLPSSMIALLLTQVDRIYFGRTFPIAELGFYALALTLVTAISAMTQRYLQNAYFPKVSQRFREAPQSLIRDAYAARWRFTLVMMFALGGLAATGELAARILFSDAYLRVGFYVAIICIGPIGELFRAPSENVLVATGFFRATLLGNMMRLAFIGLAAPFAYLNFGPLSVLVVLMLSEFVPAPYFWWRLNRLRLFDPRWEAGFGAAAAAGFAIGAAGQWIILSLVASGILPGF